MDQVKGLVTKTNIWKWRHHCEYASNYKVPGLWYKGRQSDEKVQRTENLSTQVTYASFRKNVLQYVSGQHVYFIHFINSQALFQNYSETLLNECIFASSCIDWSKIIIYISSIMGRHQRLISWHRKEKIHKNTDTITNAWEQIDYSLMKKNVHMWSSLLYKNPSNVH